MDEVLRFALLGLGLGALYSLASQGLMVIYRGSGVLNFAHGAIGMVGAYVDWEVKIEHGQPCVGGVARRPRRVRAASARSPTCCVMRQLRRASPLARIVATLGMLIVLQSAAVLRYGARVTAVQSELPRTCIQHRSASPSRSTASSCWASPPSMSDRLWAVLPATRKFGLATTAVAENQRAASSVGPVARPDRHRSTGRSARRWPASPPS